ncbi:corticotropin-releasing factor-binding protein [Eurytemora carolleeae]|uniref:corticotropin-releasing factor-binding protein n=1 Tax=Eurytemora carolleeae TaxID=1294199 RepID=UPI000C776EFA|nr:corticotropin-releasing factor-binding protein [Eurytemora carolleeae]|eukprot:XP_023333201.1 corticotropin-releasing factor-binding protein-like [Eurytemora affinis]
MLVLFLTLFAISSTYSAFFATQRHFFPGLDTVRRTNSEPTLADLQVSKPHHVARPSLSAFHPQLEGHQFYKRRVQKPRHFASAALNKQKRGSVHSQEMAEGWDSYPNIEQITECMTVGTMGSEEEITWFFRSQGETETCGLYIVGEPDRLIEITVDKLDVDCSNGLIMVFNGWELNSNIFPGAEDHQLPLNKRSTTFCNQEQASNKVLVSSQNAALVSYKIPTPGQGFSVRVRTLHNPDPCNILMSDLSGYFTLQNHGIARNCSLTTLLFPANFALLSMDVGEPYRTKRSQDSGLQTQCSQHGWSDYIELGGSLELESSNLASSETICGFDSEPIKKGLTVLCGSSTVRLVSSGDFENTVSVYVKAASDDDLDFNTNYVITCPEN